LDDGWVVGVTASNLAVGDAGVTLGSLRISLMPIAVRVEEYSGARVGALEGAEVEPLVAAVMEEPDSYPLLSGIDPCDDTVFNRWQTVRLARELAALARSSDDEAIASVVEGLLGLIALIEPAPGRSPLRRLRFIGD
jgi:hypothetical protein